MYQCVTAVFSVGDTAVSLCCCLNVMIPPRGLLPAKMDGAQHKKYGAIAGVNMTHDKCQSLGGCDISPIALDDLTLILCWLFCPGKIEVAALNQITGTEECSWGLSEAIQLLVSRMWPFPW